MFRVLLSGVASPPAPAGGLPAPVPRRRYSHADRRLGLGEDAPVSETAAEGTSEVGMDGTRMDRQPMTSTRVRTAVLALAMPAALWLLAPAAGFAEMPAMHQVADTLGRFTIALPEDWTVRELGDGVHDALAAAGPADAGGARPNVVIDVRAQVMATTAAAAATLAEAGLRQMTDYRSLKAGPTTIGGVPAYYRYFTHRQQEASLFQIQVYIVRGLHLYLITGTTLNDGAHVGRNAPVMLRIIGSFRLAGPHARLPRLRM